MSKNELINFIKLITYVDLKVFCEDNNITLKEFDDNSFLLYCNMSFREIDTLQNDDLLSKNASLLTENHNKQTDFKSILAQCNGVILDKTSFNIICNSHNKFRPISKESLLKEMTLDWCDETIQNNNLFYCEDGTTIRLFYNNSEWCFATSRCNDASKSYWLSQKNYKELFDEISTEINLNIDFNSLEKNMTHFFILLHKDNRMIIPQKNNILYVNKLENLYSSNIVQIHFNKWSCELNFNSLDKRGYIIRLNNIDYIYEFSPYYDLKKIVGNTNKFNYTYLHYYKQNTTDSINCIDTLEKNYPEYKMLFTMIKYSYDKLIDEIFILYIKSHIKHTITIYKSHIFYKTLMCIHKYYKNNNDCKSITKEIVSSLVSSLDTPIIAKLLKWNRNLK